MSVRFRAQPQPAAVLVRVLLAGVFACLMAPQALAAEDIPRRKSGLWEIRTSSPAARDEVRNMHMCVDAKADDLTGMTTDAAKKMCSKTEVKRAGNRVTVDSVCRFGQTTARTHSVITGDFDNTYRVETSSTYDPPINGMKQVTATIEARWLGPCKPDQKPGDLILGNGTKVNIYDSQAK